MRANTKKKQKMGRRFAILIGVAAVGVMALGAQTASSTTGDPVDSTPPDLQLSGPKKQSPQKVGGRPSFCSYKRCNVIVRVSHTGEAFTVRAWGKLTNVKMDRLDPVGPIDLCPAGGCPPGEDAVEPGRDGIVHVGPELAKKQQRKQVRQALAEGKNVQAKVTVKATDAAGNVATAKRTITLVK